MGKKRPDPSDASSVDSDVKLARLREIVRIMEASSLSTLEYEDEDIEVRLCRVRGARAVADDGSVDPTTDE